jgi:hypothetical protein
MRRNSSCPIRSALCKSSGVRSRCKASARAAEVLASAVSAPLFACRSNSAAIANHANAIDTSFGTTSSRS